MSHIQTRQPFEIPDSAVSDPQGKRFGGLRARVYWLLARARHRGTRFDVGNGRKSEPGWVPLWAVREPWSGGVQGDRRLRELRTLHGYRIEKRVVEGTDTTVYRIAYESTKKPATRQAPAETIRRHTRPLRGVLARIVEEPGQAADEILLEPGHVAWPELGGHHAEGWREQMRAAWKRKDLLSWIGRRELVIVLRPEDADTLLFDLRHELARLLAAMGADVHRTGAPS